MHIASIFARTGAIFLAASACALSAADLKPLLAQPDQAVLQNDFSVEAPLNKQHWRPGMGTRWTIADGVLRGIPSTPEYQASKPDHKGFEPRVSSPVTPPQFIAEFSVRFTGGSETPVVPFAEFGHHVARVKFSKAGTALVADGETVKLAEAADFKYEPGRWYHVLAELKGDEFVIQFADGPTLYAKHECFAKPNPTGGNGLGVAGPKDGTAELDNVKIWSVRPDEQPTWAAKRATFPKFEPVVLKERKEEKAGAK